MPWENSSSPLNDPSSNEIPILAGGATHLHTSLLLEKRDSLMTSGAIQAYVPAALILVVWCHSLARPKSVIFKVLLLKLTLSRGSRMRTDEEEGEEAETKTVRPRKHIYSFNVAFFHGNSDTVSVVVTYFALAWIKSRAGCTEVIISGFIMICCESFETGSGKDYPPPKDEHVYSRGVVNTSLPAAWEDWQFIMQQQPF